MMAFVVVGFAAAKAQKFALVDMEYILSNVPAYEVANNQLDQLSQRWQKEVEGVQREAETMYKNYQSQMPFLTDEQKKKKKPTSWLKKRGCRATQQIFRP